MRSFRALFEAWDYHRQSGTGLSQQTIEAAPDHFHTVKLFATQQGHKSGKHYDIDYSINGHMDHAGIPPSHAPKLLHHVLGQVHQFVRDQKPKSVRFIATHPVKGQLYSKLANSLARHYGGRSHSGRGLSGEDWVSVVDFPGHPE